MLGNLKITTFTCIIWVAPWAGKMNKILCCYWLPEQARGNDLARLGLRALSRKKISLFWCLIPYNKSFIDQACSVKMAGYWPCSFFCEFMDLDFISVHKHLANIQPSWPHAWSITHNPCVKMSSEWDTNLGPENSEVKTKISHLDTKVEIIDTFSFLNIIQLVYTAFCVICMAAIFHHPSFNMYAKQTRRFEILPITIHWHDLLNLWLFYTEVIWSIHRHASVLIGSFQTACWWMLSKDECWML